MNIKFNTFGVYILERTKERLVKRERVTEGCTFIFKRISF